MVVIRHSRVSGNEHSWAIPANVTRAIYLTPRPAFLDSSLRWNDNGERTSGLPSFAKQTGIDLQPDAGVDYTDDTSPA